MNTQYDILKHIFQRLSGTKIEFAQLHNVLYRLAPENSQQTEIVENMFGVLAELKKKTSIR